MAQNIKFTRWSDVSKPRRNVNGASFDLFLPGDRELLPCESATINLEISFEFPSGVCGLLELRPSAVRSLHLRMQPIIVGK